MAEKRELSDRLTKDDVGTYPHQDQIIVIVVQVAHVLRDPLLLCRRAFPGRTQHIRDVGIQLIPMHADLADLLPSRSVFRDV